MMSIGRRLAVGAIILIFVTSVAWAASGNFNGLYFEIKGRGKPVVLIHGGQLDRRMWDAQFDEFAKRYRVIRYDLRGFGKSSAPSKPFSNHEDLHALLRRLQVEKATLVGLSLGGAVAVDFALMYPNEVDSLVLVCPGLGGFHFEDKANDLFAIIQAAQEQNDEKVTEL
jgi:3-oxoadipate enol-lactonase